MALSLILVSLLMAGCASATPLLRHTGDNQVTSAASIHADIADKAVKPVGFLLSAKIPGNTKDSGKITPLNTDFFINYAYSVLCYPTDKNCKDKYEPSILFYDTKPYNYITLNSTAAAFGENAPTQSIYVDYKGALRYLTPPEAFLINNEPAGNWAIVNGTKGSPATFKFIGTTGEDSVPAAPFYACAQDTGPVFKDKHPLAYQVFVGTQGFKNNINPAKCFEITPEIQYTDIGGYLFA